MAETALPLTALLKKDQPERVVWTDTCENALTVLKNALLSKPCLIAPEFGKPFHVFTDASLGAISAWLGQEDDEKRMHPIAFSSYKRTPNQVKWSIVEKELFAIVKATTETFRHYIYGAPETIVHSDHQPLAYLHSITDLSPRLTRWSLLLSDLNLKTVHISGADNIVADSLSRL